VAATLPASVQSLLTARVDRLAPTDRALLQAASVIGRRFDPQLLAAAVDETGIDDRLTAIQASDLVNQEGKSGEYAFKQALVRDALYQNLLTEARKSLHLKIATKLERRSGNRLAEVAEALAHHDYEHHTPDYVLDCDGCRSDSGVASSERAIRRRGVDAALSPSGTMCPRDCSFIL
jgi:predicted ATPase